LCSGQRNPAATLGDVARTHEPFAVMLFTGRIAVRLITASRSDLPGVIGSSPVGLEPRGCTSPVVVKSDFPKQCVRRGVCAHTVAHAFQRPVDAGDLRIVRRGRAVQYPCPQPPVLRIPRPAKRYGEKFWKVLDADGMGVVFGGAGMEAAMKRTRDDPRERLALALSKDQIVNVIDDVLRTCPSPGRRSWRPIW
jgi:hypothetical protein